MTYNPNWKKDMMDLRTSQEIYRSYRQQQIELENQKDRKNYLIGYGVAFGLFAIAIGLGSCVQKKEHRDNSFNSRLERVMQR